MHRLAPLGVLHELLEFRYERTFLERIPFPLTRVELGFEADAEVAIEVENDGSVGFGPAAFFNPRDGIQRDDCLAAKAGDFEFVANQRYFTERSCIQVTAAKMTAIKGAIG